MFLFISQARNRIVEQMTYLDHVESLYPHSGNTTLLSFGRRGRLVMTTSRSLRMSRKPYGRVASWGEPTSGW